MNTKTVLRDRWMQRVTPFSSDTTLAEKLLQEITTSYSESSRHYHTLAHLQALLVFAEEYSRQLKHPVVVDFAIFYHDIIYKASRSDNEEQSARVAEERLAQIHLPKGEIAVVSDFILATKKHAVSASPYEEDLKWFLDFDLSILGAGEDAYMEYVKQIRKEFKIYPDLLYKPGRRKVLQHFLDKESIYKTDEFRNRFEQQARLNLANELKQL